MHINYKPSKYINLMLAFKGGEPTCTLAQSKELTVLAKFEFQRVWNGTNGGCTCSIFQIYFAFASYILLICFIYTSCMLHIYFLYASYILLVCFIYIYFLYASYILLICFIYIYFLYASYIYIPLVCFIYIYTLHVLNCIAIYFG